MPNLPVDERLELPPEEMRALGYRFVDLVVEHFAGLPDQPTSSKSSRADLEARLRESLPETPRSPDDVLSVLKKDVLANMMHVDHPRYFAFIPGPSNYIGVLGDLIASGLNVFAGTWLEASGPAQIELVVVDWLRQVCRFPETAGGLFLSGGSAANLTGLALARQRRLGGCNQKAVVYGSHQAHSSVERALRVLGFRSDQFSKLETDGAFRLSLPALRSALAADREAGRRPFCVVANAGTTNTGAVDPLPELARICREEDLWLHLDGAYGAAAMLTERGRALLEGMELADSLALDAHKWLFQPYEAGCLLVRDARWLKETFQINPEYLKEVESVDDEVNFCDYGIQLTRSFRALKLWLSFQLLGAENFRKAIERGFRMAELAEELLGASGFEIVTPAQLAIVSFRLASGEGDLDQLNRLNRKIVQETIREGFAMVSSTVLRGTTAIRLCTINPRTTEVDLRETIQRIASVGKRLSGLG